MTGYPSNSAYSPSNRALLSARKLALMASVVAGLYGVGVASNVSILSSPAVPVVN